MKVHRYFRYKISDVRGDNIWMFIAVSEPDIWFKGRYYMKVHRYFRYKISGVRGDNIWMFIAVLEPDFWFKGR
jgi:hypothetical protein